MKSCKRGFVDVGLYM